jgi:hypothetical protein
MAAASIIDPTPQPWRKVMTDVGPAMAAAFTQAADFKASGIVPTTIIGAAAAGSKIVPSTALKLGAQYTYSIAGTLTAAAAGADTITLALTLGGVPVATAGPVPIFFSAPGTGSFILAGTITCRSVTGTNGDFIGSGLMICSDPVGGGVVMFAMMLSAVSATVPTNAGQEINVLASFNGATPSITTRSVAMAVGA